MGSVRRSRGRRPNRAVRAADRVVLWRTVRRSRRGPVGALLSAATVVGDRGLVWLGLGAALAATPAERARRAGIAGLAAQAVTSAGTQGLKRVVRRRRPPWWLRLGARGAGRAPSTSSFPSGHAANGAAFTAAVALQSPVLGLALAPLTLAVASSRLVNARHHPSDTVASLLLGAGAGVAAGLYVRGGSSGGTRGHRSVATRRPSPGADREHHPAGTTGAT